MKQAAHKPESGKHSSGAGNATGQRRSGTVEQVQQQAGNMAVQGLYVQTKLAVSQPDDPYEREADQVARQVMRMPADRGMPNISQGISRVPAGAQQQCHHCSHAANKPTLIQAKKHHAGNPPPAVTSTGINAVTRGGRPLGEQSRAFFEPRFGRGFNDVRIHADSNANQAAKNLSARAFTAGNHIVFARGQYRPDDAGGRQLLAHELTHVVQQQGSTPAGNYSADPSQVTRVQREVDPASEDAWDDIENPDQYNALLNKSVERSVEVEQELKDRGEPHTDEEKEAFAERAETLVRLNALGMMAAHKATVEGTRDRLLSTENRQQIDSGSASTDNSPFKDLRKAAAMVQELQAIHGRLESYRSALHVAHSRTLFRRGSIGDGFEDIVDNGDEFITSAQRQPLRESYAIAQRRSDTDTYWFFLYGATSYLEDLRKEQIFGVEQAISKVFQTYPFFAELDTEDIVEDDDLKSDKALWEAIEKGYGDLIEEIDEAIVDIGSGDIHPFDLPRAVALTRETLPVELQTAMNDAIKDREVTNFTIGLGVALAFALLPVLGAIAGTTIAGVAGVAGGVAMFGVHLEDMLDRLSIAEASFDPYDDPLGVVAPSSFEWVMLAVEALLVAFGAYGVWRAVRPGGGAIQPPEQLLERVGKPSGGVGASSNRPHEMPYHNPPEMVVSDGRRIDITRLDPNRKYLWLVDDGGNMVIAPEHQPGFGVTEAAPGGRVVKHGDMAPGPSGQSRGSARAGGELYAEFGKDGKPTGRWVVDNNSSYTFNRADQQILPASSLDATKELLELYGTDVSKIVTRDILAGRRP